LISTELAQDCKGVGLSAIRGKSLGKGKAASRAGAGAHMPLSGTEELDGTIECMDVTGPPEQSLLAGDVLGSSSDAPELDVDGDLPDPDPDLAKLCEVAAVRRWHHHGAKGKLQESRRVHAGEHQQLGLGRGRLKKEVVELHGRVSQHQAQGLIGQGTVE
jgi:hypothetical protein